MSKPDLEKWRSVGAISRRSGDRVSEGRVHPETGVPYKATTNEAGGTVIEHATKDDRVDVNIRPDTVKLRISNG